MAVANKEIKKSTKAGVAEDSDLVIREFPPEVIEKLNKNRKQYWSKFRPSDSQKNLLEKYDASIKSGTVENDIDKIIPEDVYELREVLDNMIRYGDRRVFKILPTELDEKIKTYGFVIEEALTRNITRFVDEKFFIIPESYQPCHKCGQYKSEIEFFKSSSDTSRGFVHVCKKCCAELFKSYMKQYKDDVKESLIIMCQKLDIYAYAPTINKFVNLYNTQEGKDKFIDGAFFGNFMGELNIQKHHNPDLSECNFEHSNFNGVPFKCVKPGRNIPNIYYDKFFAEEEVKTTSQEPESENYLDTDEKLKDWKKRQLTGKFGNYEDKELKWLEKSYKEWEESYDISALNSQKLIIQLCCDELRIYKDRASGVANEKEWKTYMATMKELDLTPKKQAKNSTSSGFGSLGEFIREAERTGPIVSRNKDFSDIDGIRRIIIGISGAMARTLGKNNDLSEAFEREYEEYTSTMLVDRDVDDDADESLGD